MHLIKKIMTWINSHILTHILAALCRLYFWLRLNWIAPGVAVVAILWFLAYSWLTLQFWPDALLVEAPTLLHTKQAVASEAVPAKEYSIKQVVDTVHLLESSGGVKDGCIAKGKINGFGYAQSGSGKVWNCYKNYAEVRGLVESWFTKRIPEMGLPVSLCYYNSGHKVNTCKYYEDFLKLVK